MARITSKGSNIKFAIEVATALVKEVPIYGDTVQPAAKQIGESLETVAKTVNIALAPLKGLVWGYDQIESWLTSKLAERFKTTPSDKIVTPSPQIGGPAIEALRYLASNSELRDLYTGGWA